MQTEWRFLGGSALVCVQQEVSPAENEFCFWLCQGPGGPGLVGRRDSTGAIKAIWDTAHHPSLGPYGGSQHVLTPVWGVRVCSLQKAKFFLHREYVISYRSSPVPFHPCEYYVTMETALKLLWNL